MKKKSIFFSLIISALFMSLPVFTNAQFGDPDPDPPLPDTVPFYAGLKVTSTLSNYMNCCQIFL